MKRHLRTANVDAAVVDSPFPSNFSFAISALGVALVRDSGALMVGQYFRRRRDAAEAALTASAGIGIAAVSCIADATMR